MGSMIGMATRTAPVRCNQRSKGDRLGWELIGKSVRTPLSELVKKGGRVSGNYCVTSCKKLIP